jgi:hypothetical protein
MRLHTKKYNSSEKIHHLEGDIIISSFFNKVFFKKGETKIEITLPSSFFEKIFGLFRISRRLLRLDMCTVLFTEQQLVLVRKGFVYHYNLVTNRLTKTLKLKQCDNILHQSICQSPDGKLFFGEYGGNPKREPVNIYCSEDFGKSWKVIFKFKAGQIRHIHGCYYDKFTNRIWTLTGDFKNENIIQISDLSFKKNEIIGDGSQKFRAVNLFFEKEEVHWMMDSPLEKSYKYTYNRATKITSKGQLFNGPIWFLKRLSDGYYLAGSSVEKGIGVLTNTACLYISKDLKNWECVREFEKDKLPMPYFKWGVLAFSNGNQSSKSFSIHFEGLKGVDGKSYICSIEN